MTGFKGLIPGVRLSGELLLRIDIMYYPGKSNEVKYEH